MGEDPMETFSAALAVDVHPVTRMSLHGMYQQQGPVRIQGIDEPAGNREPFERRDVIEHLRTYDEVKTLGYRLRYQVEFAKLDMRLLRAAATRAFDSNRRDIHSDETVYAVGEQCGENPLAAADFEPRTVPGFWQRSQCRRVFSLFVVAVRVVPGILIVRIHLIEKTLMVGPDYRHTTFPWTDNGSATLARYAGVRMLVA